MAWDYAWKLGPKGGTLVTVADYGTLRLLGGAESIAGKRGNNVTNPYRPGAIAVAHKFGTELLIPIEMNFDIASASDVYTNKETFEQNLFGTGGLATLRRTTPSDTIEAYVEPIAPSQPTQDRFTYQYLLRAPEGYWRSTSQTSDSSSPVAVGGNATVYDAVVDIVGGTAVVVTLDDDTVGGTASTITISGATPAGGVRVDLENGTVTKITGGADYHEFVSFNKPYRFKLEPGNNDFSTTGSPSSVTFKFYDKYRG